MSRFYSDWGRAIVFMAFALPISIADLREFRIPDLLSLGGFAVLVTLDALLDLKSLPQGLLGAFVSVLVFALIYIITKGIGFGDIKFSALMGLLCGIPGIFAAFFFAAIAGTVYYFFTVIAKKRDRKSRIPFAPFMSFGAAAGWIAGRFIPAEIFQC